MNLTSPNRKQMNNDIETESIRKCIVASVVLEYSALEIVDVAKRDLKSRCKVLLSAARSVQSFFENHPDSSPKYREIFKRQFLSNEILIYGEILGTIQNLTEDSLMHVLEKLRVYVDQAEENQESSEILKSEI